MKNLIILTILVLFSVSSCQNKLSEEHLKRISLENEVMVLHDTIMAKGDKMQKLTTQLNKFKENIPQISSEKTAEITIKKIDSHVFALTKADEMMMDWMKNYQTPAKRDTNNIEKEMKYLLDEKAKILLVGAKTSEAIKNANILKDELNISQK